MSDKTSVTIGLAYKINMGNFENLDVKVEVTDGARQDETVRQLTDRIYKFVETELVAKVKEVKKELE